MSDEPRRLKYSDSPFAPDWARKPKTPETISDAPMREMTSFGKPIPEAPEPEGLRAHFPPQKPENNAAVEETEAFRPTIEQIEEILWKDANDDLRVYCIIDGYWAYGLYGRLLNSPDISWAHMFQGDVATKNVQQAPFIIALKRGHKLTKWLIEEGWGQGWGIYFTASTRLGTMLYGSPRIHDTRFLPSNEEQLKLGNLVEGPEDPLWKMRRHFRSFSDVYYEPSNKIVDFRYYDPAVLKTYLLSCNKSEISRFIGPINRFYAEGYCEVESLNQPEILYQFQAVNNYKSPDFKGSIVNINEGQSLDLRTGHQTAIPLLPASQGTSEIPRSIFPVIRQEQINAFKKDAEKQFEERMFQNILNLKKIIWPELDLQTLRAFVSRQIKLADTYLLKKEKDVLAFLTGAFLFGEGFENQNNDIKKIIDLHKEKKINNFSSRMNNYIKTKAGQ